MATVHYWPSQTSFDDASFRADSEQLEQFRTRDFSSMEGEIAELFQIKANRPAVRAVPLVYRVTRDIASLYVRPPSRDWSGVPVPVRTRLDDILNRSDANTFLRTASRQYIGQNTVIVTADQVSPREVSLRSWLPYQARVMFADPMEEDIQKAERLELLVPLSRDDIGTITWGLRIYTQTHAFTADLDGDMLDGGGIYNEEGLNPLGYIPAVAARRESAVLGRWFPPVPDDLRQVQIGTVVVLSTVEDVLRKQGFTRTLLTGEAAKIATDQMQYGAGLVEAYPGDDLGVTQITPAPPTDKTLAALETTLRMYGASTYVNLQTLLSTGSGITGDAKAMEVLRETEHRRELELDFQALERDLARLILDTVALSGAARVDASSLDVSIDYHYVEPKKNELQQMQAAQAAFSLGMDTPIDAVARSEGIPREKAKVKVMARLAEMIEIGRASPGGMTEDAAPDLPSLGDNNVTGGVGD
jgi:hypothetical protein